MFSSNPLGISVAGMVLCVECETKEAGQKTRVKGIRRGETAPRFGILWGGVTPQSVVTRCWRVTGRWLRSMGRIHESFMFSDLGSVWSGGGTLLNVIESATAQEKSFIILHVSKIEKRRECGIKRRTKIPTTTLSSPKIWSTLLEREDQEVDWGDKHAEGINRGQA